MSLVNTGLLLLLLVTAQRIAELILDRRNTSALLSHGGEEHGAKHYPLFIILHSSWLISLYGWLTMGPVSLNWVLVSVYVALQGGRIWVLLTLGAYWTTRIITLPDRPLVKTGPYRLVRHPNYWIVCAEIAVLPMAYGAWHIAVLFSVLNGLLLRHRIGVENAALASRRALEP